MRYAPLAAALVMALLAGCGGSSDPLPALDPKVAAIQDAADTDALLNQLVDAATQALIANATAGSDQVSTTRLASSTVPGGMSAVDLKRLAAVSLNVDFATLVDASGAARFPDCHGTFVVQADGVAVSSWPTASSTLAAITVTLIFDTPVYYSDPSSGSSAVISGGTLQFSLETQYTYTSAQNWVLQADAKHLIASGTPLSLWASRSGRPLRAVTVFGARDAHWTLTRVFGATNRYTIDATVDGLESDGTTLDGVNNLDSGNAALSFTNWDATVDTHHVVFNRNAHTQLHWDFAVSSTTRTIDAASDEIFVTYDGTQSGPFTGAQLLTTYQAASK